MISIKKKKFSVRHLLAVSATLCGMTFAHAAAAQSEQPAPVPLEQAAYHVPAFHNEFVTVLWVDIPGKHASDYHIHSHDQSCVVLDRYPPEGHSQVLGEQPGPPRRPEVGEVSFVAYFNKPLVAHRAINPGTLSMHQICAQLTSPKPYGFTPAVRDASSYTQVLDNDRLRAWWLVLKPGQTAATITQNAPGLRVVITGGQIEEVSPGKRDRGMVLRPDHFYWQDAGAIRAVRNTDTTPIELVEYEFK
jgi:hypothetical protein